MHQLEIEVLYNLQCESAATMFDLRDVVTYIAERVGLIPGRVWFGAVNTREAHGPSASQFLTLPQPPRSEAVPGAR
jgi:hypothetical protein